MICDYHLHSSFSGDSDTPAEAMIQQSIQLGMNAMCFTDHYDMDFPVEPEQFLFNIEDYFKELSQLKDKYKKQINISIGVELGLQKHLQQQSTEIVQNYPFDFVIGSSHVINHMDPYYPEFFQGKDEESCYREYFQSILDNITVFQDFDVYGHIDYIVRYGPNKNKFYTYEAYKDILDKIIEACVQNQIGLELNTGGLAYELGHPNPHPDIIRKYREAGGEIITVGSDAHTPQRLAYEFSKAREILLDCGFQYYTIFKNRKPEFIKL